MHQGIWTICDVCAKQIRTHEATLVRDKYSRQNGFLVCSECLDPTQSLLRPVKSRERPPAEVGKLRKPPSGVYLDNPNSSRVPSAPQRVIAFASTLGSTIVLRWEGPLDTGSDRITGYLITRATPQLNLQWTLEADTNVSEPYFEDTTGDIAEEYAYTVAAINSFGVGATSELAFYPAYRADASVANNTYDFLLASDTSYNILDGAGNYIIAGN